MNFSIICDIYHIAVAHIIGNRRPIDMPRHSCGGIYAQKHIYFCYGDWPCTNRGMLTIK